MVTAVICEYNPFHKGHKYQLDEIRRLKPDTKILSVMSPNFVQRGQPALFDKYVRGECAVRCGADIAVSMPQVFSLLSAEGFAECGVRLASRLGAKTLSFGVENDDVEKLKNIAKTLISDEFEEKFSEFMFSFPSLSFPTIRQKTLEHFVGKEGAEIISTPNNILGVEYIKAIMRYCPDMEILPIKRKGNGYNDSSESGDYLSATAIRQMLYSGKDWKKAVPNEIISLLSNSVHLEAQTYEAFLFSVLTIAKYGLALHSSGGPELANTIITSIAESGEYSDFRQRLSRKKFVETRIDRTLVNIMLGLRFDEYMHSEPEYATVLAMNSRGRDIIKKCDFPLISRYADGKKLEGAQIQKELLADRIWARCTSTPMGEKYFINKRPFMAEDNK